MLRHGALAPEVSTRTATSRKKWIIYDMILYKHLLN